MENIRGILIVSSSFYPEKSPRSFRTTELVKEFARQGHKVTLLTKKNDEYHRPFEREFGVKIKDFGPLKLPTINRNSGHKILSFFKEVLYRGLDLFLEYPDIELLYRVRKALKYESGYDLLISIAVPHPVHWGVAAARSENHPIADVWAADCGDPYMGFTMHRFGKPFYFKYPEKSFCRKADYITVPIEKAKEGYYEEFRDKIRVIPQGFNFEEVELESPKELQNEEVVFGYAGNLWGGGRNPDELLEYLTTVRKKFKFVIYTQNTNPLKPYLNKIGNRIVIKEYIPRNQLLKELSEMNFLVNLENATNRQAPSKLIDYYLAQRPVLSIPSRGLNTQIVYQFLEGNYSAKYVFKNMEQYRIENVCSQFLELCQKG